MSKLKRLLGALSLVSLFIFSSCVDDEIAPEVTALRQAQVDLLNAEVAFQNAETALKNAEVEAQNIANQYASASNAIALQAEQAGLDTVLLNLEVATAEAQADLLAAELRAEEAAADLEQYLATAGLEEAAFYLEAWNTVMTGGTVALPSAPDIKVPMGGLRGKRSTLITKQADLAVAKLFLSGDSIPQTFIDSLLALDLSNERTRLETNRTLLAAWNVVLDGLENQENNYEDAIDSLHTALIALAADSMEAQAAVKAAEDALAAVGAAGTAAQADTAEFHDRVGWPEANQTMIANLDFGTKDDYKTLIDRKASLESAIKAHVADSTLWRDYADSLQSVYDEYYDDFQAVIEEYNQLKQDSADAAQAAQVGSAVQEELELETAFAAAVQAERIFKNIFDSGNTPSVADTAEYVQARTAWDGAVKNDLFASFGGGDKDDMLNDLTVNTSNPTNGYAIKTAFDGTDNPAGPGNGSGGQTAALNGTSVNAKTLFVVSEGGAAQAYLEASGQDPVANEAVAEANFALAAVRDLYKGIADEFASLELYITNIENGKYTGNDPYDAFSPAFDLTGSAFAGQYNKAVDDAAEVLDDLVVELPQSEEMTIVSADLSIGNNNQNYDDLLAALKTARENLADTEEDIDFAEDIVAPYLEDYNAALATLKAQAADSLALDKVAPTFAVETAKAARSAVFAAQSAIRTAIADLVFEFGTWEVNDNDETYRESLETKITDAENRIGGYEDDIEAGIEAIAELEVDIVKAGLNQIKAEDMIAEDEQEIAELQAEIAFLEQLAAEFQALLEAALAG